MPFAWSINDPQWRQWKTRLRIQSPTVVTWLFIGILSWQLAKLTWQFFPQATLPSPEILQPTAKPVSAMPTPDIDIGSILNANLFGRYDVTGALPTDVPETLQETTLNLTLMGTIMNQDPKLGFAIIRSDQGTEKKYAIGELIAGQTRLHSVQQRKVILQNGTQLEELNLPMQFEKSGVTAKQTRPFTNRGEQTNNNLADWVSNASEETLLRFTEIIRPVPKYDSNGQLEGFRVYAGKERTAFLKSGLRPGDLVTSINGQNFGDQAEIMAALGAIEPGSPVTIAVNRNGEEQTLNVDTQAILDLAGTSSEANSNNVN